MSKKTIGMILTGLIIGTMIVLVVKSNMEKAEPLESLELSKIVLKDERVGFREGDVLPDFELSTLSGEVVKLSDYRGKKVILNFWASWCGPCKAEMPHMENYYRKNKGKDNVEIIAVNLLKEEKNGVSGVEDFVDAYDLSFPVPLDLDGQIMKSYQVLMIPTTYLINTDGTIKHKIVAPMDEKMIKSFIGMLK